MTSTFPMVWKAILVLFFCRLELALYRASSVSHVELARRIRRPSPNAVVGAEFEHSEFWKANGKCLNQAWKEIGLLHGELADFHAPTFVAPVLYRNVKKLMHDFSETNEDRVKSLWKQVAPGVWSTEHFLQKHAIQKLREELKHISASGIPTRRPNGMNRYGVIIDNKVDGAVPLLSKFVDGLVNEYIRPLGRAFFPSKVGIGDDQDMFAFTVRYKKGKDVKLNEHRDASVITLNLNLNVYENRSTKGFTGSSLYFVDKDDPSIKYNVSIEPGQALIHTGELRHAALPLESGERENLIVWLFGKDGYVRTAPYKKDAQLTISQRWSIDERQRGCVNKNASNIISKNINRNVNKPILSSLTLSFLPHEREQLVKAAKVFEKIHKHKLNILFVCEGNTCRSAFAEYLTNRALINNAIIRSSGIDKKRATKGSPMNSNAQIFACGSSTCDGNRHSSTLINWEMVYEADIVVFMNKKILSGAKEVLDMSNSGVGSSKFVLLSDYSDDPIVQQKGIADPWFKDNMWYCQEDHKACRFATKTEQFGVYHSTMLVIKHAIYNLFTARNGALAN